MPTSASFITGLDDGRVKLKPNDFPKFGGKDEDIDRWIEQLCCLKEMLLPGKTGKMRFVQNTGKQTSKLTRRKSYASECGIAMKASPNTTRIDGHYNVLKQSKLQAYSFTKT
ncbi:hypothetical protein PUNSTDRAFT_135702 [Punctularia strigosozonata HHB-11173 SS5]|uniref:uncharacterized protein n=1 Tax=Punctularia strigosozonata (strain HHB-11173) TaxID=741275 RepID=UPI0004417262|nr:uncharacterized protein PUNSTDRAFT_135702 [Punctularia strigosozonata HHB-11173 SS5]EIN07004.1 hypothetical protein PUNSTDRAFT_135702 [Punctularia strigosozonata HHB-11173 SS5]